MIMVLEKKRYIKVEPTHLPVKVYVGWSSLYSEVYLSFKSVGFCQLTSAFLRELEYLVIFDPVPFTVMVRHSY